MLAEAKSIWYLLRETNDFPDRLIVWRITNEGPVALFVSGSDALGRIDKEPTSPESIQGKFAEFHRLPSYLMRLMYRCRLIFVYGGHKFRAEIIQRLNDTSEKEHRIVIMTRTASF